MATNPPTQKRTRVEYTQQFAQLLESLANAQLRLEQNQITLENTISTFLDKEQQVIRARNKFVTIGISLSLVVSVASLAITIFLK